MSNRQISNRAINQVMLIAIIILACLLIFRSLSYYLPGFLGAITLYIVFRNIYFKLTEQKKWNPTATSLMIILMCFIFVVIPIWGLIDYIAPRITAFLGNTEQIVTKFNEVKKYLSTKPFLDQIDLSDSALIQFLQGLTRYLPNVINSVAELLINLVVTFFVLFFMQVQGRKMEDLMHRFFPFSEQSRIEIWEDVDHMVRNNAIGIPILGIFQGIVAIIGYYIFGVNEPILWGIVTGIATVIPVLGTMAVYIPICIVAFATGPVSTAIWLSLYCFFLIGGIDNILRFTILKTLGNVHPLITVFGVLLGLNLFGMLGLIFGPLLMSAVSVLIKVYRNEYGKNSIM